MAEVDTLLPLYGGTLDVRLGEPRLPPPGADPEERNI